ncbi:uncharacterized protein LOC143922684 [Arctopsyche grandis]|uniref:uncharacterized protein LOC143922684 n=1 Tax=Arctopsyche grandis TaxID=121162 RepID=UPI00406D9D3E
MAYSDQVVDQFISLATKDVNPSTSAEEAYAKMANYVEPTPSPNNEPDWRHRLWIETIAEADELESTNSLYQDSETPQMECQHSEFVDVPLDSDTHSSVTHENNDNAIKTLRIFILMFVVYVIVLTMCFIKW